MIDGEIEVRSEAGSYTAGKGAFVLIPEGGVVHCFKNKSDRIAHILCTVAPSGLEEFFIEIGLFGVRLGFVGRKFLGGGV